MTKTVFLLTSGDGSDGNEWNVISIHSSLGLATIAKQKYEAPITRWDGSTYSCESQIEEWEMDSPSENPIRIFPEVVEGESKPKIAGELPAASS
jgi:hypothetical protein